MKGLARSLTQDIQERVKDIVQYLISIWVRADRAIFLFPCEQMCCLFTLWSVAWKKHTSQLVYVDNAKSVI